MLYTIVAWFRKFVPLFFFFSGLLKLVLSISKHPLILIVSFDGFRHDFIDKNSTPNLFALSQMGARAKYIRNVFPTFTFTNHMSIATGIYAEDHGVLASNIFFNGSIHSYNDKEFLHYNKDVVPIWTLNELGGDGRHSGSMMWTGGEFEYRGVNITHQMPLNETYEWPKRVDRAISWFLNKTAPANLVMLYFNQLDYVGHYRGVDHPQFKEKIQECDQITKYIVNKLNADHLRDKVNVFFLSDHGMISMKQDHIINLNKFADLSQFKITDTSPTITINAIPTLDSNTKKELINTTYSALKAAELRNGHFKVYLKDEIPEKYHYKHNLRAPDMLAIADLEYAFQDLNDTIEWFRNKENLTLTPDSEFGVHGYSNEEPSMFPFFVAAGPNIKRNVSIAPFDNVDLYPLWAHILKLPLPSSTPRYQIRGNITHVTPMLINV